MKKTVLFKLKIFIIVFFILNLLFIILSSIHSRRFITINIKNSFVDLTKNFSFSITKSFKSFIDEIKSFIELSGIIDLYYKRDKDSMTAYIKKFIDYQRFKSQNTIRAISVMDTKGFFIGDFDEKDRVFKDADIYLGDDIKKDSESYYISVFIREKDILFKIDIYFLEFLKNSELSVLSSYSLPVSSVNIFYSDKMIYSSSPYVLGTTIKEFLGLEKIESDIFVYKNKVFISNYQEIFNNYMFFFLIEYDYQNIIGFYDRIIFYFLLLSLFILVIFIYFSNRFLMNNFSLPLKDINNAIEDLWESKKLIKLEKYSKYENEFGVISRSFLNMLNQVRKNIIDLINAKQSLEELNKAKDEFLAILAHEIKTPLNGILGTVDIFFKYYQDSLSKELIEGLSVIKESGERLLRILNSALTLSEFEIDKISLNKTLVNIDDIVDYSYNLFNSLRSRYDNKKIDFIVDKKTMVQKIITDKDKVVQVVSNLINNAIKFTEKGYVKLSIYDQDDKVYFEVSDTGQGIPGDKLSRVFEKFFQVNILSKTKEGLGLGLYISKKIINLLGGDISVTSKVGEGTNFRFYLPITIKVSKSKNEKSVLIFVDDDEIMFNLSHFFESNNIRVLEYSDNILEVVVNHLPDIILFDACSRNGLEFINNLDLIKQSFDFDVKIIPLLVFKDKTVIVMDNTRFSLSDEPKDLFNVINSFNDKDINKVLIFGEKNICYNTKEVLMAEGFITFIDNSFSSIDNIKPDLIIIKHYSPNEIIRVLHYIKTNSDTYIKNIKIIVFPLLEKNVVNNCAEIEAKSLSGYSISDTIKKIKKIIGI